MFNDKEYQNAVLARTERRSMESNESPAPRAGEGEQWRVFEHYRKRVLNAKGVLIAEAQTEEQARQIVTEHNQHTTLVEQRDRLLAMLRQAREFICVQTWPPNKPRTADTQRAKEAEGLVARIDATITTIEQEGRS